MYHSSPPIPIHDDTSEIDKQAQLWEQRRLAKQNNIVLDRALDSYNIRTDMYDTAHDVNYQQYQHHRPSVAPQYLDLEYAHLKQLEHCKECKKYLNEIFDLKVKNQQLQTQLQNQLQQQTPSQQYLPTPLYNKSQPLVFQQPSVPNTEECINKLIFALFVGIIVIILLRIFD